MSDVIIIFMKNLVSLLVILVVITAVAFRGYMGVALAASQSEGEIPQSGDLCSGMGGKEIVSVGKNTIIIKQEDSSSRIINLTGQTTIKRSIGEF